MAHVKLEGLVVSYEATIGRDGWPMYYWIMTNRYGDELAWGSRRYSQIHIDAVVTWLNSKLLDRHQDTESVELPFDPEALRFVIDSVDPPYGAKTVLYAWRLEGSDGSTIAHSDGGSDDYTEKGILSYVKWLSSSLDIPWAWSPAAIGTHLGNQEAKQQSA